MKEGDGAGGRYSVHSNGNLAEKLKLIYFKDPRGGGEGGDGVEATLGQNGHGPAGQRLYDLYRQNALRANGGVFGCCCLGGAFCSPVGLM